MSNVTKTVSFRSPYIGRTFQRLTQLIQGSDGYLAGGLVTDNGVNVTVGAFSFAQFGVVVEEADATVLPVPTVPEPWFVLAATPDDEPESGVTVVATGDIAQLLDGDVLIAYKSNGAWKNPRSISIDAVRRQTAVESGAEEGFQPFPVTTGADPASITDIRLSRGLVVDPHGSRRELENPAEDPVAAFGAEGLGLVRDGVGVGLFRSDYAVLRQNEDGTGSIVHVYGNAQGQGGAIGDNPLDEYEQVPATVLSATGTLPSSFGRRGDRSHWHCWGDGNQLKINGFHQTGGAIASTTVLTGSGSAVHSVAIAGQNSDNDLIVVYSDTSGTQDVLQVVRVNPSTGAIVGSASGIATSEDPGGFVRTKAVMGPGDVIHIVTQEDLSRVAPDQVVRYFKISAAAATFGTSAGTTPDLDLGTNDTYPSIGLDRRGHAHIAYTRGSGGNEYGELRYVEIDELGVVARTISATIFAGNADPYAPGGVDTVSFDYVLKPSLVVTPHDEVYVFSLGYLTAGGQTEVVVFSPTFSDRFAGHHQLQLSQLFGPEASDTKTAIAAIADDHGGFIVGVSEDSLGLLFARLDTKIAPDGVVGRSYLEASGVAGGSMVDSGLTGLTDLRLASSGIGGALWGYLDGSTPKGRVTGQMSVGRRPTAHPNDVYLATFEGGAPPYLDLTEATPDEQWFRAATLRPKQGGHTIVVGDGGDYAGSLGLVHAIGEASMTGAEVVVKGGGYVSGRPLVVPGGMKIRGERTAKLHFHGRTSTSWLTVGQVTGGAIPCASVAGDNTIVTLGTAQDHATRFIRPGDTLITNTDAGEHKTVVQVLDSRRVILSDSVTVTGLTNCTVYASNVEISGVSCTFAYQVDPNILVNNVKNGRIDGLFRDDSTELLQTGILATYCVGTIFERLQFWDLGSSNGLQLENGFQNLVRHCQFSDQGGDLRVASTESKLRISDCVAIPTATDDVYLIPSRAADDIVQMVNCTGKIYDEDGGRVATGIADGLIDQTNMSVPAAFADEDHVALPTNSISILEQLDNEAKHRELGGANGVYSGFNPLTSGLEVSVQTGEGIGGGKVVAVATSASNLDATGAGTEWSYYVTGDDELSAINAAPVINGSYLLVAYGVVNGTNDGFETFVDLRRFIGKDAHRSPIVVSNTETTYGGFKTLQGAVLWLQSVGTGDGAIPEIIVSEMISIPSSVTTPIEINLNSIGSLIIRGVGSSSGFKINADTSTLVFQGSGVGASGFRHVLVENIAFANEFSGTPTSSYCMELDASIDSFTARNCTIVSADALPEYGTYGFLTTADDASTPIINVEGCDLSVYSHGVCIPVNVTYPTIRTRVHGNRIHGRAMGGTAVKAETGTLWATNNVIEGTFSVGVRGGTGAADCVVSGNQILLSDNSTTQIGAQVVSPTARLVNNRIVCASDSSKGIDWTGGAEGVIVGNSIDTDDETLLLNGCTDIVVSGNRLVSRADAGISDYAKATVKLIGSERTTISGNSVYCSGEAEVAGFKYAVLYINAGSYGCVVSGNRIQAETEVGTLDGRPGGIHTYAPYTTITGNQIIARGGGTPVIGVYIGTGATDCVFAGNLLRVKLVGFGSEYTNEEASSCETGISRLGLIGEADFASFKASASAATYIGSNLLYDIP